MPFFCNAARRIITPKIGTDLYGYRPGLHSTAVSDDLTATAFCVSDGEEKAILIAVYICEMSAAVADETRTAVSKATGVPFGHIQLACLHTHSAPNLSGMEGWGEVDRPYYESVFLPAVVDACRTACATLYPAEAAVSTGKSLVGVNRRVFTASGQIDFGQCEWGVFDPNMTVAVFRRADDHTPIFNLVHYGCHGTSSGLNSVITRDWSGVMVDRLEKESGTLTGFFNGAIGDVGPRISNGMTTGVHDPEGKFPPEEATRYVRELGEKAADDAIRIFRDASDFSVPSFRLCKGTVHLPRKGLPTAEEIEENLQRLEGDHEVNIKRLQFAYYSEAKRLRAEGKTQIPPDFTFDQTIVRIGSMAFIPFPFEPFSEICLRLRQFSDVENTLALSCCNGYYAYLPSEDQLCRGGYEVEMFLNHSVFGLAGNADSVIIDENLRILRQQ